MRIALVTALLVFQACNDVGISESSLGGAGARDMGATPGGQQDIGAAREQLAQGILPSIDTLTYAGIFSEHDLGFSDGEPCIQGRPLCVEAMAGSVDLHSVDGQETLVQIGFDTGLAQPFERKPLNLSLTVDVSGSMSGDRIAAVRDALHVLVDQLRDDDLFSLVAFNTEATTLIAPSSGANKEALRGAIDELNAGGGTNIGAGLDRSFELIRRNIDSEGMMHRAMLFTDMHPNSGMVDGRTFVRVLEDAADDGIGVSSFGVGIDFGSDLANQVSQVRGGNYFHLETPEKIRKVFDEDFDLMVTPLAYDLRIDLRAPNGYRIVEAYGLAGSTTELCDQGEMDDGACIGLTVPTVFLSRGGGGIFLRLEVTDGGDAVDFVGSIIYTDDAGDEVESDTAISLAPAEVPSGDAVDPAIRMGAQLINVIDALRELISDGRRDETMIWQTVESLRSEVEDMDGRADSLLRESALLMQAVTVARQNR